MAEIQLPVITDVKDLPASAKEELSNDKGEEKK